MPVFPCLLAILALAQPVTIDPPPAPLMPTLAPDEMIDTGIDHVDRMTVDVGVDATGPYAFVIDTGADRSVIAADLARRLRLAPADPVILHGITGPEVVATVRIGSLTVGTTTVRSVTAPALSRVGIGADGLLGVDALAHQRVVLDFQCNRMTVSPSTSRPPRDLPGTIVVTARRRFGQLILTDAAIDRRKVYAVIDTGAQNSIANLALQRRLTRHSRDSGEPGILVGVTGHTLIADMAVLPRLLIGGIAISNVPIAYADIHTFARFGLKDEPAILIGMDVLRAFQRVTVDFGRHAVRFGPPVEPTAK